MHGSYDSDGFFYSFVLKFFSVFFRSTFFFCRRSDFERRRLW